MKATVVGLVVVVVALSHDVTAARILAVFPMPAKSHHILFTAVLRTLAEAGHEVVCYSGLRQHPQEGVANVSVVPLSTVQPIEKTMSREVLDSMLNLSPVGAASLLWEKSHGFMKPLKNDEQFMKLIKSNEHFDVVVIEAFFSQESLFALGHKFQAPVISLQPFGAFHVVNRAHGNSLNLAFIPDFAFPYSDHMSLYQRTLNVYSILSSLFKYYMYHIPNQDQFMRELFQDPSLPPVMDIIQDRLAISFSNAHPLVHYMQPYTPNIQPIGGIHLAKESTPLPPDIERFLDGSPEGVIYFSVGSIVPDHLLGDEYFDNFVAAFRRLPQRVLWKTNRQLKNLPSNVMTAKWLPQQDVLAHPNVRVFMTHGGLFSQHEVIHAGVPVICTPYFGDQPMNARFYEEKGVGVILPFQTLSENTILSALATVLGDRKYKDNMARLSRIYRDRPLSPADTLLFWVEYVIRHKGSSHLRPASAAMPFYQYYLLDVIGTIFSVVFVISFLLYVTFKRLLISIFKRDVELKTKKSKKVN